VPYELVKLDLSKQESRTPAYVALHPFGEVPVLVDGDVTLFESSAICLYLADRFPEKRLAPSLGSPDRGPYLQWMLFAEVVLEPVVLEHYRNAQLPDEKKVDLSKQKARLDEVLAVSTPGSAAGISSRVVPSLPPIWSRRRSSTWRTR